MCQSLTPGTSGQSSSCKMAASISQHGGPCVEALCPTLRFKRAAAGHVQRCCAWHCKLEHEQQACTRPAKPPLSCHWQDPCEAVLTHGLSGRAWTRASKWVKVAQLCPTLQPHRLQPTSLSSVEFFRQEYWSGLPFPSPGIFPTQRSNLCLLHLLHCRQMLYCLNYQGSPLKNNCFWTGCSLVYWLQQHQEEGPLLETDLGR